MPIDGLGRDELLHRQSRERATWNGTDSSLRLGEGLPYGNDPATLATRSTDRSPGARRDHTCLCRYRPDHGEGLGSASRPRLDWKTFQSRLGRIWLLLGEILTTLDLKEDEPAADLCGSCTLCVQACPTGAIVEPYVVDARLCISYLTIELRGGRKVIPDDLASQMGNRIFGCDDCL